MKTAPGLVELQHQEPDYEYRAISPEGVVMGVRVVDVDKQGDLEFWTRADVRCACGSSTATGKACRGGRREVARRDRRGTSCASGTTRHGKPYLYTLRIFVGRGRLFLVETGGPKKEVEHYQGQLDWMQASLKLD